MVEAQKICPRAHERKQTVSSLLVRFKCLRVAFIISAFLFDRKFHRTGQRNQKLKFKHCLIKITFASLFRNPHVTAVLQLFSEFGGLASELKIYEQEKKTTAKSGLGRQNAKITTPLFLVKLFLDFH